jgi:hypothetical protein
MAKVYTTVPGAEMWISHHGPATNDRPCLVPEAVGAELAGVEGLRVEQDEPAQAPPRLAHKSRILAPLPDRAAPSEKE